MSGAPSRGGDRPQRRIGKSRVFNQNLDPRQTTLTQIDFVSKLIPPDMDLECIEFEQSPSPKRRKLDVTVATNGRQLADLPEERLNRACKETTGVSTLELPNTKQRCVREPQHITARSKSTAASPRDKLKTPPGRHRYVVPSSQSPEDTPFSVQTIETDRSRNALSPLERKQNISNSSNHMTQGNSGETSLLFSRALELGLESGGDYFDIKGEDVGRELEALQPDTFSRSRSSRTFPNNRLEASTDAPGFKTSQERPAEPVTMAPPAKGGSAQVPSSQMTTQDPSQMTSQPTRDVEVSNKRANEVPSSQMTTQDPTQSSEDNNLPLTRSNLDLSTNSSRKAIKTEPDAACGEITDSGRIRSSQATTVDLPSSGGPKATPKAAQTRTIKCEEQDPETQLREPLSKPNGHQAQQWQWDGKELTDSQLLPDSLINWSIPFPSSLSSQSSPRSIDGGNDRDSARDHDTEKTPAGEQQKVRIKQEQSPSDERPSRPVGSKEKQSVRPSPHIRRIKDEPTSQ